MAAVSEGGVILFLGGVDDVDEAKKLAESVVRFVEVGLPVEMLLTTP